MIPLSLLEMLSPPLVTLLLPPVSLLSPPLLLPTPLLPLSAVLPLPSALLLPLALLLPSALLLLLPPSTLLPPLSMLLLPPLSTLLPPLSMLLLPPLLPPMSTLLPPLSTLLPPLTPLEVVLMVFLPGLLALPLPSRGVLFGGGVAVFAAVFAAVFLDVVGEADADAADAADAANRWRSLMALGRLLVLFPVGVGVAADDICGLTSTTPHRPFRLTRLARLPDVSPTRLFCLPDRPRVADVATVT